MRSLPPALFPPSQRSKRNRERERERRSLGGKTKRVLAKAFRIFPIDENTIKAVLGKEAPRDLVLIIRSFRALLRSHANLEFSLLVFLALRTVLDNNEFLTLIRFLSLSLSLSPLLFVSSNRWRKNFRGQTRNNDAREKTRSGESTRVTETGVD